MLAPLTSKEIFQSHLSLSNTREQTWRGRAQTMNSQRNQHQQPGSPKASSLPGQPRRATWSHRRPSLICTHLLDHSPAAGRGKGQRTVGRRSNASVTGAQTLQNLTAMTSARLEHLYCPQQSILGTTPDIRKTKGERTGGDGPRCSWILDPCIRSSLGGACSQECMPWQRAWDGDPKGTYQLQDTAAFPKLLPRRLR